MPAILGSGEHRYRVAENWARLPEGWQLSDVASVAVDSRDRVHRRRIQQQRRAAGRPRRLDRLVHVVGEAHHVLPVG